MKVHQQCQIPITKLLLMISLPLNAVFLIGSMQKSAMVSLPSSIQEASISNTPTTRNVVLNGQAAATNSSTRRSLQDDDKTTTATTTTSKATMLASSTLTFEETVREEFPNYEKPYVLSCSNKTWQKKSPHLLRMLFPKNGYTRIFYDTAKEHELPLWTAPIFVFGVSKKKCLDHPWYKEAKKRRKESPKLNPPVESEWVDGVHWPNTTTSGMRLLKDRPMFIESLGEVFWRDYYPPNHGLDVVIFRTKDSPSPGALTYHDIQGVSFSFLPKKKENFYTSDKGRQIWTSTNAINDNPLRYDNVTNNKGFCALVTKQIFKKFYDMDALVRNSMFRLLNEYKPCVRLSKKCPGSFLDSYNCQSGYKFTISMENTQLDGYVSEKVFIGKLAGGVPIYFGAPNVGEYVNTKSFVWCNEIQPNVLKDFRKFLKKPPGVSKNRYFTLFNNNTNVVDMDQEKLLDWAVEYLRPYLQPCVNRIIELDQDDDKYNAIRNEPLITKPEILTGYASHGLGLAYKYLRTGEFAPSSDTV